MGKPGQGVRRLAMIIDGRQKKGKKGLEMLVTIMGWTYMLSAMTQISFTLLMWVVNIFFASNQLLLQNDMDKTVKVISVTIATAIFSFIILFYWSEYNYRRFGRLRRRRFASPVSNEELASFFNITEEQIQQMQQSKWTELDKTIV